ncbi:hypothetical protein F7725_010805 [Dissostichus mawsoni]|uniref:Uncharacterized protein n=1 Tax=Dissostichus mawsoni TaxID=36200 RepID=A0A7J5Z728_DISMA|nr:hypothetical protein F7725_010805 [Dissostichus mawsoni]
MDSVDPSPLRRFVVAKRSITSIFDQLLDFVKDGSAFVDECCRGQDLGPVAVEQQSLEMQSCATKLWTIREVLLRRHMKVAFFGRWVFVIVIGPSQVSGAGSQNPLASSETLILIQPTP